MTQRRAYGRPFGCVLVSMLFFAYVRSEGQQEAIGRPQVQSLSGAHYSAIEELIQRYNIGGIVFSRKVTLQHSGVLGSGLGHPDGKNSTAGLLLS
jgi:hypothetical protein